MAKYTWRTSTRTGGGAGNNCVEVGPDATQQTIAVRDTKDRDGGMLVVGTAAWTAFVTQFKQR